MEKNNYKISCYCPTYGRPKVLEEAIYSFLMLNYLNKELVIVNDCKEQNLIFDHPQVKIFNYKERFDNFGIKFDTCVQHCTGDYITPWDDDDIYLPWKIEVSFKNMKNGIFHTSRGFAERSLKDLVYDKNVFHCNLMLEKNIYYELGGYPKENKLTLDMELINKIQKKYGNFSKDIPDEDLFYIYRWQTSNAVHLSSITTSKNETFQQVTEKLVLGNPNFVKGDIKLKPYWKYDYTKVSQDYVKNIKSASCKNP